MVSSLVSSSDFSVAIIEAGELVLNPGKVNNSFPSKIIVLWSKYNGWFSTSVFNVHSAVISPELISLIVIVTTIPLGKAKGNSKLWPTFKFSLLQLPIISKVPSDWAFSKLNSWISIIVGAAPKTSGSVILSNSPLFIFSSVKTGFNKDLSVGNPTITSEPTISIEVTCSVEVNVHMNKTGAIPNSGTSIVSSLVQLASIVSEDAPTFIKG